MADRLNPHELTAIGQAAEGLEPVMRDSVLRLVAEVRLAWRERSLLRQGLERVPNVVALRAAGMGKTFFGVLPSALSGRLRMEGAEKPLLEALAVIVAGIDAVVREAAVASLLASLAPSKEARNG